MAYRSRRGHRPDEAASKVAHSFVINDPEVREFLQLCERPVRVEKVTLPASDIVPLAPPTANPIRHVIAIDGGYTEVLVDSAFPSSKLTFFQFGALIFSMDDLEELEREPFIDPSDIAKLKRLQRLKLVLPTRSISFRNEATLTHSIRRAIYEFFMRDLDGHTLMDTLAWLVFAQYLPRSQWDDWRLGSCPHCQLSNITIDADAMGDDFTMPCPRCNNSIFLTDVIRLHEGIDDELGAGGILGYITTAIEQILLCFSIKLLLATKPALLHQTLFIKDGPLAFFGFTANLHKPMRKLVAFLQEEHALYMAGLEKSGSFVEHADEIGPRLPAGSALLLSNEYIYTYIVPGCHDHNKPYGGNTYYGVKLIFKTTAGGLHVATLPTSSPLLQPQRNQINNLEVILHNVEKLKCDMYDSALLPVALVNKLVSLADHPSASVLKAFATRTIGP